MDKLVWETTFCFNDKFLLEPNLEITATSTPPIPKCNKNSIFLKYYLPAPKYKDLIKNDNKNNLSFDLTATTGKISLTSNFRNDFKFPHTIIPLQKAKSSYYYKTRRNFFINNNKEEQNGPLKPLLNTFSKDKAYVKTNTINTPTTTSSLSSDYSKVKISFTNTVGSTPIQKQKSFSIVNLNDKENLFIPQLDNHEISKIEPPDNFINMLYMSDKNTDSNVVSMEDVRDSSGNLIEIEKPLFPNKSFDSLLNKTETINSDSLVKKKFDNCNYLLVLYILK